MKDNIGRNSSEVSMLSVESNGLYFMTLWIILFCSAVLHCGASHLICCAHHRLYCDGEILSVLLDPAMWD